MSSCSFLPPEVIVKILSLLPGKELPKVRLVSKQFNSIISEPYFLRHRHSHALKNSPSILTAFTASRVSLVAELKLFRFTKPNETALTAFRASLIGEPYDEQTQQPTIKSFLGDRVRVFSSNHQLLCFVSVEEHFLFDPINQKTLEISKSSSASSSPSIVSFGFVSSTLQYKIIRFFLPYHPICKIEIFTLSIKGRNYNYHLQISPWKSQEQECPYILQPYPPVHADGFLYWTTKDVPTKVVSFSLEQEKFSVLLPPPCFKDNPTHDFSLCGIRGNLWAVDYNSLEPNMEIWMMNGSNGSAWVKTHRIGLKETLIRYYPSFPIRIHDIQSDCVFFQVLFPSRVKIYYPSKNEVKDFGELNQELQFCYYTDSLLSL